MVRHEVTNGEDEEGTRGTSVSPPPHSVTLSLRSFGPIVRRTLRVRRESDKVVTGNDNKTQENRDYKVMKDPVTLWSSLRPSFVHSVSPIHTLRERTKRADGARLRDE